MGVAGQLAAANHQLASLVHRLSCARTGPLGIGRGGMVGGGITSQKYGAKRQNHKQHNKCKMQNLHRNMQSNTQKQITQRKTRKHTKKIGSKHKKKLCTARGWSQIREMLCISARISFNKKPQPKRSVAIICTTCLALSVQCLILAANEQ